MTSDTELFNECRRLERYGYVFHITSREWKVMYNPGKDRHRPLWSTTNVALKRVTHFHDGGGSDSRNHEMLGRDNLISAVKYATGHLGGRLGREFRNKLSSNS